MRFFSIQCILLFLGCKTYDAIILPYSYAGKHDTIILPEVDRIQKTFQKGIRAQSTRNVIQILQIARILKSSLINIKKILNTPIPKFCDGNKVNVTAAELQLTKMRSASFYKKNNLL